jgi:dTDP-4-dehydrorhamnose reductase
VRILVVGGSGFLGRELARRAVLTGHRVTATYLSTPVDIPGVRGQRLDLRRAADVTAVLGEARPEIVINAAYRQSDWTTTADGAATVATATAAAGARLIHVSSDAVFAGTRSGYDETCTPDPVTAYGAAKAAAETVVKAVSPDAVIARTSLIIGDDGSIHEHLVHGLIDGSRTGVLFTDDMRCPVHVNDLSEALLELATGTEAGIRHVAGAQAVSRYELGVLIARRDGLDETRLRAGRRADTDLTGPIDVRLDSTATQRNLTTRLRGAPEFLAARTAARLS